MKINGNAIKQGNVIEHKGALWVAVKTSHVKPGKGGAFAQVELKNLRDNTKLNERFRSSETVERVILEEKKATYLYEDGDKLVFMDAISFEQKFLLKELIGEKCIGATSSISTKDLGEGTVKGKIMWAGKCNISDATLERVKNYKKPK